ncbi:MAG: hypothetical protein ACLR4A_14025 [Christensenellales bacterium]
MFVVLSMLKLLLCCKVDAFAAQTNYWKSPYRMPTNGATGNSEPVPKK